MRAWEVRWQGLSEGLWADELRASALMFEEITQVTGCILLGTLERVEGAVDAVSVGGRSAPDVVAQVHSGVAALGLVAVDRCVLEEGVEVW